jgi:SNF family Na+-dependent transporter
MSNVKEQWGSRIGVIMAVAGSAVGLGNFLRFPGKAAENGGGAFMIPYFVALLLVGIPLCWAEWAMGRYGGRHGFNSAPGIFSVLWKHPLAKYLGALALLIPMTVYFYYIIVEAWCLGYAWNYLTGTLMMGKNPEAYKDFFTTFTGSAADASLFSGTIQQSLIFIVITFGVNFLVAIPMMAICAMCVLIRVLTLPANPQNPEQNVVNGLGYMWNPKLAKLSEPETWLAAAGQIFFTLSVGFGVIINYASYVKPKKDIALSGLTATSVNEFFEVCLGGMITIPAAFIFIGATTLATFTSSSFSLGFNALPNVFAEMPGGQVFGFLWFFMLFLAAITSSLSMLQPVMAFFEEGLGLTRKGSTLLMFVITSLGTGFVMYYSKNLVGLDSIDFWSGELFIVVLALVQAIIYGWVFGTKLGQEELDSGAELRVPRFVQFVIKFVSPAFLIWILYSMLTSRNAAGTLKMVEKLKDPIQLAGFSIVMGSLLFLWVMVYFAGQRWKKEGRA